MVAVLPVLVVLAWAGTAAAAPPPGSAAGSGCSGADAVVRQGNLKGATATTLCLVNGRRRAHGLPAVRPNARLRRAARGHTVDMARRNYFDHVSLSGSTVGDRAAQNGYRWSAIGEIIGRARGRSATPRTIVGAWMNSPGHRDAILTGGYRDAGAGVARGSGWITFGVVFGHRL